MQQLLCIGQLPHVQAQAIETAKANQLSQLSGGDLSIAPGVIEGGEEHKPVLQIEVVDGIGMLHALQTGEMQSIDACFMDHEFIQNPKYGVKCVLPIATFYAVDFSVGRIYFMHFFPKQIDDQTKETTFGVPEFITNPEDVHASEVVPETETCPAIAKMTLQDFVQTGLNTAVRSIKDNFGIALADTGIDPNAIDACFFAPDNIHPSEIVEIGLSMQFKVTVDKFKELHEAFKNGVGGDYEKVDLLSINIGMMVEEMDLTTTIGKVISQLVNDYSIDPWSQRIFNHVVRKELAVLLRYVTYGDLVKLADAKHQAIMARKAEEEARLAQEAQAAAEGQPATEGTVIEAQPVAEEGHDLTAAPAVAANEETTAA